MNYSIRQIRRALNDDAVNPTYIETLPKQGYRFIAALAPVSSAAQDNAGTVSASAEVSSVDGSAETYLVSESAVPASNPGPSSLPNRRYLRWALGAIVFVGVVAGVIIFRSSKHPRSSKITITQITDFTDSAASPTLSPDGKLLAFFRGPIAFVSADPIYMKALPDGEPQRVTDDPREKYNIAFSPDGKRIAYTVLMPHMWDTFTVPIGGGEPQLLLKNARRPQLASDARSSVLHRPHWHAHGRSPCQ